METIKTLGGQPRAGEQENQISGGWPRSRAETSRDPKTDGPGAGQIGETSSKSSVEGISPLELLEPGTAATQRAQTPMRAAAQAEKVAALKEPVEMTKSFRTQTLKKDNFPLPT